MLRRLILGTLTLLVAGAAAFFIFAPGFVAGRMNPVVEHRPYPVSARAGALHDRLIVGDLHADTLLWDRRLTFFGAKGHTDLPRLRAGNVALQVFTAVTKSPAGQNIHHNDADAPDRITWLAMGQLWPPRTWTSLSERALYQARKLERVAKRRPEEVTILRSRADLDALLARRAEGATTLGAILGIEGAHALEGDPATLDRLERAGFRLIGLHHFFDNELGGSLHGAEASGLTAFGRTVVQEVEARGMILDLAHSGHDVVRDVLAMTDMPVVVSHTGIYGQCPVQRNLPDHLMKDVVANGGLVGIGYWPTALCGDITPSGIARTIVTAVELLGEDHVALGSDFDGSVRTALDASELAAITHELLVQGLAEDQVAKVMGANMVRLLGARLP